MRRNDQRKQPDCPCSADIPALLQGECSSREAARLERHLQTCQACSVEQAELASLIARLKSGPGYPPHPDLAPSILATFSDDAFSRGRWRRSIEMAAHGGGVLAAAGILVVFLIATPSDPEHAQLPSRAVSRDAVIGQAIDWLLSQQQGVELIHVLWLLMLL